MKRITILILTVIFSYPLFLAAQVGVGTTTPNTNAQLDIVSTSKGVLLPRLSQTEANALATALTSAAEPAGMLIENTSVPCIQRWNGTSFECLAVVTGGGTGNDGAVKINLPVTLPIPQTTDPGYISLAPVGSNAGNQGGGNVDKWYTLNVTPASWNFSSFPTTSWPENAFPDTLLADIFLNDQFTVTSTEGAGGLVGGTADAFVENHVPGQIHIWRVNVRNNAGSASQEILNARLRNPLSGFTTAAVTVFSPQQGSDLQTVIFITIADDASLPAPVGTGNGYVLEFRSGSGAQDIWVESITRISLFKD